MKKLLLLLPVGLLAATGWFWFNAGDSVPKPKASHEALPQQSSALFAQSEQSLRQIIRHGNQNAISILDTSLDTLSTQLDSRKKEGISVEKTEQLLTQYRNDSHVVTDTFVPALKQLRYYDSIETAQEKKFVTSLDQIGLYELKTAYEELNNRRTDFIKEPNQNHKNAYNEQLDKVKTVISELYLDSEIDQPLFSFLNNHKLYFDLISDTYAKIGFERINRLRETGYSIRSELQLLPLG